VRRHARLLVLVSVLLVSASCTRGYEEAAGVLDPSDSASPTAAVTFFPNGSGWPAGPAGTSLPRGPTPIQVRTPVEGDDVRSPLVVSGTAISSTGEVVVRVIGADRLELASTRAPIDCGATCRGGFRVTLAFYTAGPQQGAVQVFELGSDGSADHLVEVPVTLALGA